MNNRIIIICAILVVIILIITAVCIITKYDRRTSMNEYTDVLGIPPLYSGENQIKDIRGIESIEDSFIEEGAPQKIVIVKDKCKLFYVPPVGWDSDSREERNEQFRLVKIEIFGKEYRFGDKKIGIGSSKAEIEDVYHSYYVLDPDRYIYISFSYDSNDIVNLITLSIYG